MHKSRSLVGCFCFWNWLIFTNLYNLIAPVNSAIFQSFKSISEVRNEILVIILSMILLQVCYFHFLARFQCLKVFVNLYTVYNKLLKIFTYRFDYIQYLGGDEFWSSLCLYLLSYKGRIYFFWGHTARLLCYSRGYFCWNLVSWVLKRITSRWVIQFAWW